MKKLFLFSAVALLCLSVRAQDEAVIINGSKKISRKLTPQQVIDSLTSRFPDAHSIKYYKVPPDAASKGWTVSKEDNLTSGETVDYYTISFKRADLQYYGLFAPDGRLIRSKQEESADNLPEPVKFSIKSLGAEHPGYKVISKKYFKNIHSSTSEEYYEIIAENGNEKKSLYYRPDGTLVQIK
ncbi:MAG TPA: hypothetical protein VGN00_05900 [Puia sp.]|jgi:hypothetical protein